MTSLVLLLGGAAAALAVARWRTLPSVPLLIIFGAGLSATGVTQGIRGLDDLLILGLVFLVFTAGTELDPRRFTERWTLWAGVGVVQFLVLAGAGWGVGLLMGWTPPASLYLGLGLAASSTLVVVSLLQSREHVYEPYGRLVLGVLLVQDVFMIFALTLLSHLDTGWPGMALSLVKASLLMLLAWLVARRLTPRVLAASALDDEFLLLYLLAVLLTFVGVARLLDLPLVAGAFWAGVGLTGFPVHGLIRGQLQSLSQFFTVLFFVALGAVVPLPGLEDLPPILGLSLLVVLVTPPLVTFLAERMGLTTRAGLEAGLILSQTSEFSIILVLFGVQRGHIGQDMMILLGWVTILTMLLTPLITTNRMAWRLMRLHPSRWQELPAEPPTGHLLLIGAGETGSQVLEYAVRRGQKVVVIDEDPQVVQRLRQAGYEAIRGDGADFRTLRAAGAARAAVVVSTMRRLKDHAAILKCAKGPPVLCRVFEEVDAERIRQRGGIPVLISRAAAESFMAWYDAWAGAAASGSRTSKSQSPQTRGGS
ncbi:MAG: cation:proton antiporter [Acidobacteriota bacterium]